MQLNVLRHDPAEWVRQFLRCRLAWCSHLAEPVTLDAGVALVNPQLPTVMDANCVFDLAIPAGMTAASAIDSIESHFRQAGASPLAWLLNPAQPAQAIQALKDELRRRGQSISEPVMAILRAAGPPASAPAGIRLLPARSAYRQATALAAEQFPDPAHADAAMLHLDDPHYEAFLAMEGAVPVGRIGVLTVGETGLIEQFYVSATWRGRGLDVALLTVALDLCARGLLRTVFAGEVACEGRGPGARWNIVAVE